MTDHSKDCTFINHPNRLRGAYPGDPIRPRDMNCPGCVSAIQNTEFMRKEEKSAANGRRLLLGAIIVGAVLAYSFFGIWGLLVLIIGLGPANPFECKHGNN